jgi:hypothetical protein
VIIPDKRELVIGGHTPISNNFDALVTRYFEDGKTTVCGHDQKRLHAGQIETKCGSIHFPSRSSDCTRTRGFPPELIEPDIFRTESSPKQVLLKPLCVRLHQAPP